MRDASISRAFTSISWALTSQYFVVWTIGVDYTSNLKSYCTLKNNSHWIRVLHYCCLLLAASMATTIEQLPVKDRLSQQFSQSQGCFRRARWFWNTMLVMFNLNVFYLPTLKDIVGHYKLWNEVMFWFTNDVLQCLHSITYKARYVQKCRVMRFMLFMISITKNPILYSLY